MKDSDITTIVKYAFETHSDYGKMPVTKAEFWNKFDPLEYRNVLYDILVAENIIEDVE